MPGQQPPSIPATPTPTARPLCFDRFEWPGHETLLRAAGAEAGPRLERASEVLAGCFGPCAIEWRGPGCGWCARYPLDLHGPSTPALWMIFDPARPHLLFPLDPSHREKVHKLHPSRSARERLNTGRAVGDRLWIEWLLDSDAAVEEACRIVPMLFEPQGG